MNEHRDKRKADKRANKQRYENGDGKKPSEERVKKRSERIRELKYKLRSFYGSGAQISVSLEERGSTIG